MSGARGGGREDGKEKYLLDRVAIANHGQGGEALQERRGGEAGLDASGYPGGPGDVDGGVLGLGGFHQVADVVANHKLVRPDIVADGHDVALAFAAQRVGEGRRRVEACAEVLYCPGYYSPPAQLGGGAGRGGTVSI